MINNLIALSYYNLRIPKGIVEMAQHYHGLVKAEIVVNGLYWLVSALLRALAKKNPGRGLGLSRPKRGRGGG